jgi:signal transduction histidine kinase
VRKPAGSDPTRDAQAPPGPRWAYDPGESRFGPSRWPGGHRGHGGWLRGPRARGPLRRSTEDRLAGGVAGGLAGRLGLDSTLVRLVLIVATLVTGGYAAVAYILGWLLIPAAGTDTAITARARSDRRGIAVVAALVSLLVVLLVFATVAGLAWLGPLATPLILCVAGLVLIWRNASADEREALWDVVEPLTGGRRRSRMVLRALLAVVLLAGGVYTLWSTHRNLQVLEQLGGVLLVIAAIAVLLAPWWIRIARDLVAERQARIRAEERAEMAARVHDSVLQTLAMIQRRADEPQQVVRLARAQERELRSWLFDGRAPGSMDGQATTLAAGVRLIQQEVEATHGITVEAVTVGDCDLDDGLSALLAAAREATVNAAKWSGTGVVSLFAEVEPDEVSLFVRDRGRGFDPEAVPADRKGLAESVRARMARRGGSATVRSTPGQGTEVSLTMPRAVGERQPSKP